MSNEECSVASEILDKHAESSFPIHVADIIQVIWKSLLFTALFLN